MRTTISVLAAGLALTAAVIHAQQPGPADHPAVTVKGQIYTPASILARNMGSAEDQDYAMAKLFATD